MILSLMLALLTVQGPTLTSAQAGAMTRAVVDQLLPTSGMIDGQKNFDRTIIFDQAQTVAAFRAIAPGLQARDVTTTLPSLVMTRDKAITCDKATRDCTVSHDGVFFTIERVSRAGAGEYQVAASIRWAHTLADGRHELRGEDYELTMGLVGAKWKQWKALRSRSKPMR